MPTKMTAAQPKKKREARARRETTVEEIDSVLAELDSLKKRVSSLKERQPRRGANQKNGHEKREQREKVAPDSIFSTIHTQLTTNGIVILYRGKIPANPWNLYERVVSKGEHIAVKVDDAFVRALREREGAKR